MTPVHPTLRSLGLTEEQNTIVTERLDRDAVLARRAYGGKVSTLKKIAERVLREASKKKPNKKETAVSESTTEKKSKKAHKAKEPKAPRALMNFDPKPKDKRKEPREGSFRAKIVNLLAMDRGTTLDEINNRLAEGKWTRAHTRAHVLLVHEVSGYGLRQDETGRLFLVS